MPRVEYDRIKALLQAVLASVPESEGRASGFVQRESKVTAVLFVQMLVLGCWRERVVKLADLVLVGRKLGVAVSIPGLNQRITGAAVALLRAVLSAALAHGQRGADERCASLVRFAAVYLQDSTQVNLPAGLASLWAGSGGNAAAAAAKVVLNYEYRSGVIAALQVVAGRTPDQGCRLTQQLAVRTSLHIFDLGFYALEALAQLAAAGSFFLCRHQYQSALHTREEHPVRIDLLARLKAHHKRCHRHDKSADVWEFAALLGARQRLPVRIVVNRLPPSVVAQRRRRIRANAQRRRTTPAPLTLALAEWNLFCTNVPADWWSTQQVIAAYRIRWQVELLFKLAKSQAGLDHIGDWRQERVLCFLYARLIVLVLSHHLTAPLRFPDERELSPAKALHLLQHSIHRLIHAAAHRWRGLRSWLAAFADECRALALKDQRTSRPSTYQHLCELDA
jgi:hypothetical protein